MTAVKGGGVMCGATGQAAPTPNVESFQQGRDAWDTPSASHMLKLPRAG